MATKVTLTFLTRYGLSFVVRFYVPAAIVDPEDALITAIVTAINAACACVGVRIEISVPAQYAGTAGTGATNCTDKAVIVVPDDDGENHIFKVPAPKVAAGNSIFTADNATLDLADANVIALNTALTTYGVGRSGDLLTDIKKGHRAGGKALAY
jgi:hypothetical protein